MKVLNILADGRPIEDISKAKIPGNSQVYTVLNNIARGKYEKEDHGDSTGSDNLVSAHHSSSE